MKQKKGYGFTTTRRDNFVERVAKEAQPKDRFLVVQKRDSTEKTQQLTLLVREDSLPPKSAGFKLADRPVGQRHTWGKKLRGTAYRVAQVRVKDAKRAANIAKNEIQRIKNFVTGRTSRVLVEAL